MVSEKRSRSSVKPSSHRKNEQENISLTTMNFPRKEVSFAESEFGIEANHFFVLCGGMLFSISRARPESGC